MLQNFDLKKEIQNQYWVFSSNSLAFGIALRQSLHQLAHKSKTKILPLCFSKILEIVVVLPSISVIFEPKLL
jgi:uncharacterized membrane protein